MHQPENPGIPVPLIKHIAPYTKKFRIGVLTTARTTFLGALVLSLGLLAGCSDKKTVHEDIDATARISPIANVEVQQAAPPTKEGNATSGKDGQTVYNSVCSACHATGVANAPKSGSQADWEARLAQGKSRLYQQAINGFNAMPARGGSPNLSDDEVKSAVDHMLSLL